MKKAKKIMLVGIMMLLIGIIGAGAGGSGPFFGILAMLGVFVCIIGRFLE